MAENDAYTVVSERWEEDVTHCQECGGEIDFTEAGPYWKTADERFWHEDCYDLIGRVEDVTDDLERLINAVEGGETVTKPLEEALETAHGRIDRAVRQERLMKDQELGLYDTDNE